MRKIELMMNFLKIIEYKKAAYLFAAFQVIIWVTLGWLNSHYFDKGIFMPGLEGRAEHDTSGL